jgi:hypothetical protein
VCVRACVCGAGTCCRWPTRASTCTRPSPASGAAPPHVPCPLPSSPCTCLLHARCHQVAKLRGGGEGSWAPVLFLWTFFTFWVFVCLHIVEGVAYYYGGNWINANEGMFAIAWCVCVCSCVPSVRHRMVRTATHEHFAHTNTHTRIVRTATHAPHMRRATHVVRHACSCPKHAAV